MLPKVALLTDKSVMVNGFVITIRLLPTSKPPPMLTPSVRMVICADTMPLHKTMPMRKKVFLLPYLEIFSC